MQDPKESLTPEARERIHAAKNAAQADELARQEQAKTITLEAAERAAELAAHKTAERLLDDDRLTRIVDNAVKKGFSFGEHDEKRFIDITQVKLICQSIIGIDRRLTSIEGNLSWGVKIVLASVFTALMAVILMQ